MTDLVAAVKVRGDVDAPEKIRKTVQNLGLEKSNQIGLYEDNESVRGMLKKAKDFIAYGEISEEVVEQLEERYGKSEAGEVIDARPPSKGFRSAKKNVNQGGSLGNHGNIDDLIKRMV
jgi:large subunit ribosomal protein L30